MRIGLMVLGLLCLYAIYADDAKPLPNGAGA